MIKDYVLTIIREYAYERWKDPRARLSKERFKQRSYQQWAVNEITRSIETNSYAAPIIAVEEFACKMDNYSLKNDGTRNMFSVAHDVACDILDMLNAAK